MIDLHMHILPGLDDGAQSMEEAVEMAQIAAMDQKKRYYTSTPEMLKRYAEMVPPVDEQK